SAPAATTAARLRRVVVTTMAPPAVRDHEHRTRPRRCPRARKPWSHTVAGARPLVPRAGRTGRPVLLRGLGESPQPGRPVRGERHAFGGRAARALGRAPPARQ